MVASVSLAACARRGREDSSSSCIFATSSAVRRSCGSKAELGAGAAAMESPRKGLCCPGGCSLPGVGLCIAQVLPWLLLKQQSDTVVCSQPAVPNAACTVRHYFIKLVAMRQQNNVSVRGLSITRLIRNILRAELHRGLWSPKTGDHYSSELLQTQTFRKPGPGLSFFLLHRICVGHLTASLQL